MEPLFHVGDLVVVDEGLQEGHRYFFERVEGRSNAYKNNVSTRLKYRGIITEVRRVNKTSSGHIYYSLGVDNEDHIWPASMLLPAHEVEYSADIGVLF